MKKNIVYIVCLILLVVTTSFGQSLFKDYTEKSQQDLIEETDKMSAQIVTKFNQQSMEITQKKIYFYDYFSNLKKLVLYGAKLATYAEYEQDLKFAKQNELFKGLPEKEIKGDNANRSRFANEKYKMMRTNIKDEIDTYKDLIQSSLDSCEHLSLYDFTESSVTEKNKDRIRYYFQISESYKTYLEKRDRLVKAWPLIGAGIKRQVNMWQEKGLDPEDPIIDLKITEAISNEGAV